MDTIVVTGASGNVGGEIARILLASGKGVRAVARDGGKLAPLAAKGAEARAGDLGDISFLKEALRDASAAFVMIPPPAPTTTDFRGYQRRMAGVIAGALKAAGVRRAVALSSVGAEVPEGTGPIKGLHDFEKTLAEVTGLELVVMRPAWFMENHLMSIGLIQATGMNGGAIRGDLPFSEVATRDIAAFAAAALADSSRKSEVRYLLGPRDWTLEEASKVLGAAIGKPELAYIAFPYEQVKAALMQTGLSGEIASTYVEMGQAFNEGRIRAERTPEATTPTPLEEFAKTTFAPAFRLAGHAA
ncbi:MAG TPA: NAD(P)H-binding protein [Thermoanaerobaculia bacterium]